MSDIVTAAIIGQTLRVSRINETRVDAALSASFSTVTTISGRGFLYMLCAQSQVTAVRVTIDGGTPVTYTFSGTQQGSMLTGKYVLFGGVQFDSSVLVEATNGGSSDTISIIWGQS